MSRPGTIPHLPALDGLRGVALLGVLFFHSRKLLVGGYLGVDLFFVLSGYLITSLLLAEKAATGKIALGAFWIRRARRLFPALLSLMPAVALYCWLFAQPDELARVRSDALATLAYVANWSGIFAKRSYWELFAAPSPLEHTWSLAIEEQFYIVWPLVAVWALRRGDPRERSRRILKIALVGIAASMATMIWLYSPAKTSRVYFGTDTRATAILAGIALAAVLPPTTKFTTSQAKLLDSLGFVAALGMAIAWWRLPGEARFLYRGGFWLTELAGLVLIACAVAGPKESLIARMLSIRPLVYVGLISYGLYLWHWPIDVFLTPERFHIGLNQARILQFAATFAIAIASYRFFERPIRTRGLPFGHPGYIVPAAVALCVMLVVSSTHARPIVTHPQVVLPPPEATGTEPKVTVMILGDSTANSLGWTLRGVRKPGVTVELQGKDGCTMVYDTCRGEEWAADVERIHPDITLMFGGGAFLHPWEASNGDWVNACHREWDAQYERVLTKRLPQLVAPNSRVFVVTLPHSTRVWDGEEQQKQIDCVNAVLRRAAATVSGIEVLDLGERVCPRGQCILQEPGAPHQMRPDGIHYDMEGAHDVASWVLEQVVAEVGGAKAVKSDAH
jgi:peptidoglycan/LPS O-acetylase OafA/YrhL